MTHKSLAILALLLVFIATLLWFPEAETVLQSLDAIRDLGPWAAVAFGALYVLGALLIMPASLLTIAAGFLFGLPKGVLIISLSSTLGATLAMLNGRYLLQSFVATKLTTRPRLQAILQAVEGDAFRIVTLVRLSPLFPYNLTNYAFGLTDIRTRDFTLASWIAMLPGTILYVSIGAAANSIAELTTSGRPTSPLHTAALIVGILATLLVTTLLARHARNAIAQETSQEQKQTNHS